MLVHLLRSHPDICSHGEVFSPKQITGLSGSYQQKNRSRPEFLEEMSRERDRDPIKFLYKIVLDLQGKKVVGFKLKHDELVLPDFQMLRAEIVGDLDFRIIHLRRDNLLRRFLSHHIATQITRVTLVTREGAIPEVPAVKLDPKECERDFQKVRSREKEFLQLFAHHRSFSITYEEIADRVPGQLDALQDFLGVSRHGLSTSTQKLGRKSLREAIENYGELEDFFRGTDFSGFFDEP